jgi:hypothetical protein
MNLISIHFLFYMQNGLIFFFYFKHCHNGHSISRLLESADNNGPHSSANLIVNKTNGLHQNVHGITEGTTDGILPNHGTSFENGDDILGDQESCHKGREENGTKVEKIADDEEEEEDVPVDPASAMAALQQKLLMMAAAAVAMAAAAAANNNNGGNRSSSPNCDDAIGRRNNYNNNNDANYDNNENEQQKQLQRQSGNEGEGQYANFHQIIL